MNLLDVAERIGLEHVKADGDDVIGLKNGGFPTLITKGGVVKLLKNNVLPSLVYDEYANRTFVRPKGEYYAGKDAIVWLTISAIISNDVKYKGARKALTSLITPMVHDKMASSYIYNVVSYTIRIGEKAGVFICDDDGDLSINAESKIIIIDLFFGDNAKEEKSEVVKEYHYDTLSVDDMISMVKDNKFLYIKTDNHVEVVKAEDMQVVAYPDVYLVYNGEPFEGEIYATAEEAFNG